VTTVTDTREDDVTVGVRAADGSAVAVALTVGLAVDVASTTGGGTV
jgi:hypothetical protein